MTIETEYSDAEQSVLRSLLFEICDALVARGSLSRHDIAGALLRTEFKAEILDDVGEEAGSITRPHAGLAKLTTEEWQARFGLEPSLYTLRKLHTDWLVAGQRTAPPLAAEAVAEASRDDDE